MNKKDKTIVYDPLLQIEAYHFKGIAQPFPNHFHEYYVIGFIEKGKRTLICKNQQYQLHQGHIIIFNPYDSHSCIQSEKEKLNYQAINISTDAMKMIMKKITGQNQLPFFKKNVIFDKDLSYCFRKLHQMIMNRESSFEKEECFLFMMTLLLQQYGKIVDKNIQECQKEIKQVCMYLEENYHQHICLDDICHLVSLSQSTLLRTFTHTKGITPYRYLMTIRINKAKKLLEKGMQPIDVAGAVGFSDQSHFTHCFCQFIGLSPGIYRDIFMAKGDGK